jgi:uncharacterized protein
VSDEAVSTSQMYAGESNLAGLALRVDVQRKVKPIPAPSSFARLPNTRHLPRIHFDAEEAHHMGDIVRKIATSDAQPTKGKDRTLDFVFSTNGIDYDMDCVNVAGMDLEAFKRSPVICWNHDWSKPPIGRADSVYLTADKSAIHGSITFAETDEAETIYNLYLGKFLSSVSVGFKLLESESPDWQLRSVYPQCKRHITRSILLECSCVVIGSNPNALRKALSSPGLIKSAPISQSLEEAIMASNRTRKSADNTATPRPTSTAEGMEVSPGGRCEKCGKFQSTAVCKCTGAATGEDVAAKAFSQRLLEAAESVLTPEQRLARQVARKVLAETSSDAFQKSLLERIVTEAENAAACSRAYQLGVSLAEAKATRVADDLQYAPGGRLSGTMESYSRKTGAVNPWRQGTSDWRIFEHARKSQRGPSR